MKLSLFCAAIAALSTPASAVVVSYELDLADFYFTPGVAPVDPVTGLITVTFDNAADVAPTTSGLTVTGLNLALDLPLLFQSQNMSYGQFLTFATEPNQAGCQLDRSLTTLCLFAAVGDGGRFIPIQLGYTFNGGIYVSTNRPGIEPPAVPEPATWAMMVAGFGVTGAAMRASRRRYLRQVAQRQLASSL